MSGLQELPDNMTEVGHVHVSVVLDEDGPHTAFSYDGISPEAAIGYLTIVIDRLRSLVADGWGGVGLDDDDDFDEDDDELSR